MTDRSDLDVLVPGVKIHGDDMICSGNTQHVGHELGWYWSSWFVFLVLSCVGKTGNYCCHLIENIWVSEKYLLSVFPHVPIPSRYYSWQSTYLGNQKYIPNVCKLVLLNNVKLDDGDMREHGILAIFLTLSAEAILQALMRMRSSIRLSLTSPPPVWTMYTSSPRTLSPISTHVSRLANFLVTTFPASTPSLSQILLVRSRWELPLNTLMLGILLLIKTPPADNDLSSASLVSCAAIFSEMLTVVSVLRSPRWPGVEARLAERTEQFQSLDNTQLLINQTSIILLTTENTGSWCSETQHFAEVTIFCSKRIHTMMMYTTL